MAYPIPQPRYTEDEYLAFERKAEERSEYVDGVIYKMAGESPEHGRISANLVRLVGNRLIGTDCQDFTKDMKVRSGPLPRNPRNTKGLYSYPDLVVVCGKLQVLDEYRDVLINPSVIIEVLSDSTEKFDRKQKFLRYQKYLPVLTDYVLVSQDEPLIEILYRETSAFASWRYFFADGLESAIRIPSIDCELKLAEVYYRITFPLPEVELEETPLQS
ncbi:MAG: Uma2 family endonuclease [Blastocatellia bacterium]